MSVPHRKLIYGRFIVLPALLAVFAAAMTAAVQLSIEYGTDSLGAAAVVFAAVLMLLLFIGLCVNRCFPEERKPDFRVLFAVCGTILFCVITVTGLELRMNFMRIFNVVVDDYGIYEAADILRSGTRPKAGTALFYFFCQDPEYYACSAFQSVLLSVFGYRGEVCAYANLVLQVTGAFCAAGTAYVFGGRISAAAVYALLLCLPQEAAFVVRMEGTPLYFAVLMAGVFLFAVTSETEKDDGLTVVHALLYLMDGLLFGIAFVIHPVTLVIIAALFLFLCFLREKEEKHPLAFGGLMGVVYLSGAGITFFILLFLKAKDLKTSLSSVAFPYLQCFVPRSYGRFFANCRELWNAHLYPAMPDGYTTNFENEVTIVILLCLCFIVLVFSFAWKRKGAVPASALLIGLCWLCGCGNIRVDSHLAFLAVLSLAGFLPQEFYWLFSGKEDSVRGTSNAHAEGISQRASVSHTEECTEGGNFSSEFKLPPAAADDSAVSHEIPGASEIKPQTVPVRRDTEEFFVEELSDLLSDLNSKSDRKEEEKAESAETPSKKEIHYIENPLPGPKKHVPKTLDFDIDISEDDDFDI